MDERNQKISLEIAKLQSELKEPKTVPLQVVSLSPIPIEILMGDVIAGIEKRVALIIAAFKMQVDKSLLRTHASTSAPQKILSDLSLTEDIQVSLASSCTARDPDIRCLQAKVDQITLELIP